jgi:integrase
VEEIDRALCLRFKARLLSDARELREALESGRDLRDERGRRRRPLGPASVRKVLRALAAILEDAVEDELIESNPARGKRMRVRVPKPERTFLEMDELALLLEAAGAQDEPLRLHEPLADLGKTSLRVAHLLEKGVSATADRQAIGVEALDDQLPHVSARRSASGSHNACVVRGFRSNGQTQTRTGDTTIFSRVLYQLSYLAVPF